jgi:hypothetical protein
MPLGFAWEDNQMRRISKPRALALTAVVAALVGGTSMLLSKDLPMSAPGGKTFEARFPGLPRDALERRRRSIAVMEAEGVPVNQWLPVIEAEAEARLPSTEEVAMRAVATLLVASKAVGLEQELIDEYVRDYRLAAWLSPDERRFLFEPDPSDEERATYSWRFEAAHVLFWSLGFVDQLDGPRDLIDPSTMQQIIKTGTRESLLAHAKLRPIGEVLDEADQIYRYRWALVDARINGRSPPAGLSDDVAMEWHQALNWLIRHDEEPWDEMSLDT